MTTGASIEFRAVSKRFGPVVAVSDLSLRVQPGEFVTLLGPSGSGKTTSLLMVAGFEFPDTGEIFIDMKAITFEPAHQRKIGMVFQNYALFPHMTVFRNIAFPLEMRGVRRQEIERRVEEALDLVRLGGYGRRYPRQLSGGQQQRVALARALVFNPPVLLMDEPLGALDKKLRDEMQSEIKRLQRQLRITILYVTHDQEEALTLSDRVAVMNEGRFEQVGSPTDIYERPANRFVADFLGESNFLTGEVFPAEAGVGQVRVAPGVVLPVLEASERPVGAKVVVAIRPERITFCGSPESPHSEIIGKVTEAIYVGNSIRYVVALQGGGQIVVREQNQGPAKVRPGDSVGLTWRSEDAKII